MMHHMWWDGWTPWHWFGGVVCLVIIVAIIWLIVWTMQSTGPGTGTPESRGPSPLDILKERYARGEIGDEEFEQKKRKLQQ
jgi:putative membrane protein